jgi:sterol desaturase/sphingolipid hydroxylase (fatty acid hydroxylase superfamily)
VTELSLRGWSQLQLHTAADTAEVAGSSPGGGSTAVDAVAVALIKTIAWQSVLEYYWHRGMHHPPVYRVLHKLHHHYKSPQPW